MTSLGKSLGINGIGTTGIGVTGATRTDDGRYIIGTRIIPHLVTRKRPGTGHGRVSMR